MPKPTSVEIVAARRAGVTGYVSVGRGTYLGNPYLVTKEISRADVVRFYRDLFYSCTGRQHEARKFLSRDWPDGVVRIACPCNGALKGDPCHATVIKEFLETEIAKKAQEVTP